MNTQKKYNKVDIPINVNAEYLEVTNELDGSKSYNSITVGVWIGG